MPAMMTLSASPPTALPAGHDPKAGEFAGLAHQPKFAAYARPDYRVAQLGCGGGWLLRQLPCAERIGVEEDAALAATARRAGIDVVASLAAIADASIDLFISDNAFEHLEWPLAALREVHRALKPGGVAVFVVACESVLVRFRQDDRNGHLHTWSPQAFGNLFKRAGFEVLESRPYVHRWPPGSRHLQRWLGWRAWHLLARLYGFLYLPVTQIRVVARKP
jgi:SAM-dependent methyltransferase